jgi:2-methylcitrate dehydratase PrpD
MEVIVLNALASPAARPERSWNFCSTAHWTKMMHPGWGALSAVYALKMAKAGLTGPKTVFEGQYGVFPVHLGTVGTLPEQLATLGKKWLTPDIAFKLYPCCHHNHSFIDVLKKLMHDHQFTAADIEAIEARGTPMCASQICDPKAVKVRPQTEYMMKFSLYYILAMTALKGKITAEEINLKYCSDPDVLEMIDRITFITDESIAVKGHMPAKLCVTLKDGRRFCGEQKYEKSARENPIALQDILDKYYGCVSNYLDSGKADAVAQKALNFERLDGIGALLSDMAH